MNVTVPIRSSPSNAPNVNLFSGTLRSRSAVSSTDVARCSSAAFPNAKGSVCRASSLIFQYFPASSPVSSRISTTVAAPARATVSDLRWLAFLERLFLPSGYPVLILLRQFGHFQRLRVRGDAHRRGYDARRFPDGLRGFVQSAVCRFYLRVFFLRHPRLL